LGEEFAAEARRGTLTADELLTRYCTIVYRTSGSYEAAARRLGLDRRTVKARVVAASRREARPATSPGRARGRPRARR
jgi:hypothetical protein